MIRRPSWSIELPHLVAFGITHAVVSAIRPTVSYRALELGAGAAQIGIIGGAFAILSMVAAIPVGSRIDQRGERLFFMVGAATLVAAALLNSVAGAVVVLIVTQALLGFGHMASGLAVQTVTAAGPVHRRDQRFARMTVAGSAGQFVGPLVAGGILDRQQDLAGFDPTQAVFLLAAAAAVVAGLAGWFTPTWSTGTWGSGSPHGRQPPRRTREALGMVGVPGMKQALFTSVAVLTTMDILVAYLPVLGEENGISPAFVGLVLSLRALSSVISRLAVGAMIGRLGRRLTLAVNIVLSGLALIGMGLFPFPTALLVLGTVVGFGLGVGQPITSAWVSDRAPQGQVGSALALRLAGNRVGQMILPAGVGLLAGIAGTPIVFVAAALTLIGSAWWMKGAPVEPAQSD